MYSILAILAAVILYNCGDYIPDNLKDRWENSTLRKWAHPTLAVILTMAVALGIRFDVLNWGAIAIPVFYRYDIRNLAQYEKCRIEGSIQR